MTVYVVATFVILLQGFSTLYLPPFSSHCEIIFAWYLTYKKLVYRKWELENAELLLVSFSRRNCNPGCSPEDPFLKVSPMELNGTESLYIGSLPQYMKLVVQRNSLFGGHSLIQRSASSLFFTGTCVDTALLISQGWQQIFVQWNKLVVHIR